MLKIDDHDHYEKKKYAQSVVNSYKHIFSRSEILDIVFSSIYSHFMVKNVQNQALHMVIVIIF